MTVTDYADVVAALRAVPGVSDADVEPDTDGGLGLLRVGLAPGVDEVEVAATVGRLLRERFGLGVDTDKVQLIEDAEGPSTPQPPVTEAAEVPVTDTDSEATSSPGPTDRRRVAINRMQIVSSGLEIKASVSLAMGTSIVAGEATGAATQSGVYRAVVTATMRALEELTGHRARFELEGVDTSTAGGERTVLVFVTMLSSRGTERLSGSAMVREDVRQAYIRATLDAVNRRLEPLLS